MIDPYTLGSALGGNLNVRRSIVVLITHVPLLRSYDFKRGMCLVDGVVMILLRRLVFFGLSRCHIRDQDVHKLLYRFQLQPAI